MARGNYKGLFCALPFSDMFVGAGGSVHLCCQSWLPIQVGNVSEQSLEEAWNSSWAQKVRASILDGSYRYCEEQICPYLQGEAGLITRVDEIADERTRRIVAEGRTHLEEGPRRIYIGFDPTCNLECPSCRCGHIVAKGEQLTAAQRAYKAVFESRYIQQAEKLWIPSNGEAFSSRIYRSILREWDASRYPNLAIEILTNGVLLTESMWNSIANSHEAIEQIQVSTNAARRETYEAIQKGASFDKLLDALALIGRLRRAGQIKTFLLSFAVQACNFREMKEAVEMCREYGADGITFLGLVNWDTFSDEEYRARAVHLPEHPEHAELKQFLLDPIFSGAMVELGSLSHLHPELAPRPLPAGASEDLPYALELLAEDLLLSAEQSTAIRRALEDYQDEVCALLGRPAANGISPLDVVIEAIKQGLPDHERHAQMTAYMREQVEPVSGQSFETGMLEAGYRCNRTVLGQLELNQHAALKSGVPVNIIDIDTGYDPILAQITARLSGDAASDDSRAWAKVRAVLGLDEAQALRVRGLLDALKQKFAALCARPASKGLPSPLETLVDALKRGVQSPQSVFLEQLTQAQPADATGSYAFEVSLLESECRKLIEAALSPEQRAAFEGLGLNSLLDVQTGLDPLDDALKLHFGGGAGRRVRREAPGPRAVGPLRTWDGLRTMLALGPRQAAGVLTRLRELKTACAGVGADAAALETACREEIARGLLRTQCLLLNDIPLGTLATLELPA